MCRPQAGESEAMQESTENYKQGTAQAGVGLRAYRAPNDDLLGKENRVRVDWQTIAWEEESFLQPRRVDRCLGRNGPSAEAPGPSGRRKS